MGKLARKTHNEQRREFPVRLECVRQEALQLGLYATAQELGKALKRVGWELAGDVLGVERMEKAQRKIRR